MFYGTVVWDPWLIVAQIVCIQCLYYLSLGIFMGLLVGTRVNKMSLVYFFDFATVTLSTVTGWCVVVSFLLSSVAGAGFLLYLIERAKRCLDFSAAIYIIHLCICILYEGWPSSVTWWVVNGTGLAITALLGEYLCILREMRDIPISRLRPREILGVTTQTSCQPYEGPNSIKLQEGSSNTNTSVEEPPLWGYVTKIEKQGATGGTWKFKCNLCSEIRQGSYSRVRAHLLGIKGSGIAICNKASAGDKLEMKRLEDVYEEKKSKSKAKEVELPCEAGVGFKKRKGMSTPIERAFGVNIRDQPDQEIARMWDVGVNIRDQPDQEIERMWDVGSDAFDSMKDVGFLEFTDPR